jgi:hypothetical protein
MHSTLNRAAAILALLAAGLAGGAIAADPPAVLRILPTPGLVVIDADTLKAESGEPIELEVEPGEHVLRFFPYHTAGEWIHRYLVYPFSVGSDGRRTFDLNNCQVFAFSSTPQSAELRYRGRYLGRTPGEFLLLAGESDSVLVTMPGYETEAFDLDRVASSGRLNVYVDLDPQIARTASEEEPVLAYHYQSPARKLLAPDLLISLTSGVAMLATGVYFNQKADEHYDKYQKLLGPRARESEYSQMKRNDRLSKASFIVGDTALGVFGYLLVRRIIFPAADPNAPAGQKKEGLSMTVTTSRAQLSYEF